MTNGNVELRTNNRYLSSCIFCPIGCVLFWLSRQVVRPLSRASIPPKLLFFFFSCDLKLTDKRILNVLQTLDHLYLISVDFPTINLDE